MSKYKSFKEFSGYSTAFRQWRADSHCSYIHGYALKFKVWFEGDLDHCNWVVDFGCFKRNGINDWMKEQFDHTMIVASDDPDLLLFQDMAAKDLIQLRVMRDVGCEKFASTVFNYIDNAIAKETDGRAKVYKVQCWEHDKNMAEYYGK